MNLLEELGRRYDRPAELYLVGGAALCLLGNVRTTLDLDFVGNDMPAAEERAPNTLRATLESLAAELRVEIEAVPLEQFIPVPGDADTRHHLVGNFGTVHVYVFDPYSIALSKLDRGLPSDMQDIAFLVQRGTVSLPALELIVEQALARAVEFGLNRSEIRGDCHSCIGTYRGEQVSAPAGSLLFLAPLLVLNLVVIITPSLLAVRYAFTDRSGIGEAKFVGLANFQEMFSDPVFYRVLWNNVRWTLIFLTVPVAMGLLGAYLLSSIRRGQMLFRTLYFIPYVIASVVNTYIWRLILNPVFGIGPWLAERGIPWLDTRFFGRADTASMRLPLSTTGTSGAFVVLYLAAMNAVDAELYEAARIKAPTGGTSSAM